MTTSAFFGACCLIRQRKSCCASSSVSALNPRTRALRVHRSQDMIDGSVLAGGIQRLQRDQKGALVLSVEKILQFAQFLPDTKKRVGSRARASGSRTPASNARRQLNRLVSAWYGSATSFITSTIRLTYAPYNERGGSQKPLDSACYQLTLYACSHSKHHESDWIFALL